MMIDLRYYPESIDRWLLLLIRAASSLRGGDWSISGLQLTGASSSSHRYYYYYLCFPDMKEDLSLQQRWW
jgi:hypothetical protein